LRSDISHKEGELSSCERDANNCSKLQRRISELYNSWQSIESKRNEVLERKRRQTGSYHLVHQSYSESTLHSGGAGLAINRSYEDIERDHRAAIEEKDSLINKKEKLTQDEANLQRKFFTLKNMLAEKEKVLADAKYDSSRSLEVENIIAQFEKTIKENEGRISQLTKEKNILSKQANEIQLNLTQKRDELNGKEADLKQRIDTMRADSDNLRKLAAEYEELNQRFQQQSSLDSITDELVAVSNEISFKEQDIESTIQPRVKLIENELSSEERTRRNITNNLELRQFQQELLTLRSNYSHLEQTIGQSTIRELHKIEKTIQTLDNEKKELINDQNKILGKVEQLELQQLELQKKLNLPMFKGIEEKHRKKLIEYETTNLAVVDIENYHNAL
jgi:DNA repair protein RAD50